MRSSAAVDYKKYAELLEENRTIKEQLRVAQSSVSFKDTGWGNVRVADNPQLIELFEKAGSDRDKLMAFLTGNFITCWARRMDSKYTDLVFVGFDVWEKGHFLVEASPDGNGNQTYIRGRGIPAYIFKDLHLNFAQLRDIWPEMPLKQTTDAV